MKKVWLLVFISCINIITTYSQKQNNIWCFGDSAGIDFNNLLNPVTFSSVLDTRGSCVSIADTNGQLLFYANTRAGLPGKTTLIWNKNNQLMQNGDSIFGEGWYNELLILPFPGNINTYYMFSLGVSSSRGLYYSVIDMTLNGGLGKIVQKNVQLQTYQAWDAMAAIKHANGRDWWLITKDYDNSLGNKTFHVNLITPYGIQDSIQSIGGIEYGGLGNMSFSKDGNKFLFTSYNGLIEVMDFDRCTGILSNNIVIDNNGGTPRYWGSAFSSNGNVLYVSRSDTTSYLYQYDLTASNISASRLTLATISQPLVAGGALRLAPDDKIYWTCAWTNQIVFNYPYQDTMYHIENMNLSVINDPDVVGTGCNFSLYSFNLGGKRTYWGLPNNPDYELGALWGSVCDSLTNGVHEINNEEDNFNVFPNPAKNILYIPQSNNELIKSINIFNSIGQKQKVEYLLYKNREYEAVNTSSLQHGIYFLEIKTDKQKIVKRFVKE